MTPQQQQLAWLKSRNITQKLLLTFKLMQLENARITLERELRDFTAKASEDVRDFNSSLFPNMFSDIEKSLDKKHEFIQKLSALLPKSTVGSGMCLQPCNSLKMDLSQMCLTGSPSFKKSISKATLLLGMTVSLPPVKSVFYIQSTDLQSQGVVSRCAVSVAASQSEPEEKECSTAEKKSQPDLVQVSLKSQSSDVCLDLVPDTSPDDDPEVKDAEPLEAHHLGSWRSADAEEVQHQIQTSGHLLRFFKNYAKTAAPLEFTVVERHQPKCDRNTDDVIPEPSFMETQGHVFRVKGAESAGVLTYSCVIATATELWDVMDVSTDARQSGLSDCKSERSDDLPHTRLFSSEVTIPDFVIRNFEETEVVVSHLVNPGHFYIQNVDFATKDQSLITSSFKPSSSYAEQNCTPDIGTKVMCWFPEQEQWCRAQVTKICGVTQGGRGKGRLDESAVIVEVRRLDYGDTSCLPLWDVQALTSDVATLPLQALQVSLANVAPVNGTDWSEEAVDWFREITRSRIFFARLYSKNSGVTVELFLEKGNLGAMRRGPSLSLRLAQNGHATHILLKNERHVKKGPHLEEEKRQSEWEKCLISRYIQRKVQKL
ncbi:uncharacterized protein ACB058_012260 isoform 1-T2 [Synchiropus picturatus]